MTYVVRSMSTSDWNGRDPVVPHHSYLLPSNKRVRAFWTGYLSEAAQFETPQEAEAEIIRAGLKHWNLRDPDETSQVVPFDARHVPDFWDIQQMNRGR